MLRVLYYVQAIGLSIVFDSQDLSGARECGGACAFSVGRKGGGGCDL